MKKLIIVLLLVLTGCAGQKYSNKNVLVVEGATGFKMGNFIVTANHVAKGDEVTLSSEDGQTQCGKVVARDLKNDIALIKTDKPVYTYYETAGVHVRQKVFAVGHPNGLWYSELEGQVQNVKRELDDGSTLIQISMDGFYGFSGSPIFDSQNRLVGVASRFYPGTRFCMIIPIQYVILLMKKVQ